MGKPISMIMVLAAAAAACSSTTPASDAGILDLATASDLSAAMDMAPAGDGGGAFTIHVGPGGNLTFLPATMTVPVGATVTWIWDSSGHSVTSGSSCTADDKFCSPSDTQCASGATSAAGATYSHTFSMAGAYPYFCVPHCSLGMTGMIQVQ